MATTYTARYPAPASFAPWRWVVLALMGAIIITIVSGAGALLVGQAIVGDSSVWGQSNGPAASAARFSSAPHAQAMAASVSKRARTGSTPRLSVSVGSDGRGYHLHMRLEPLGRLWIIIAEGTI